MPHLAFDSIDVDAFDGIGGGGVTLAVPLGFRRAERHYAFDPGDGLSDIAVLDWRHFRGLLIGVGVIKIFSCILPRLSAGSVRHAGTW